MSAILDRQREFEASHRARGWFTSVFSDLPGEVSPAHRHGESHLLILEGSVEFTLDDEDVVTLQAGQEIEIHDGQLHAAIAGPEGFKYAFACPPEEAVQQGLL